VAGSCASASAAKRCCASIRTSPRSPATPGWPATGALAEIGIKSYPQRGHGTAFKQLADYRPGDPIRDVDWKASMRHGRPIVREYEDERDQRIVFMLDCGRRMRADEGAASGRLGHFDAALDALMLMAWVALKEGDAVGAVTFRRRRDLGAGGGAAQGTGRARRADRDPARRRAAAPCNPTTGPPRSS
jgi:uncharacterized protein (DUF58 family)